jgi:hypothetical protein
MSALGQKQTFAPQKKRCPLYTQKRPQKRISAQGHVCFTPESGHLQCTSLCLLWAKSGHQPSNAMSPTAKPSFAAVKSDTHANCFG